MGVKEDEKMTSTGKKKSILVHGTPVHGIEVDPQTRCAHYHTPIDIIAIRFPCCGAYYPCYECHLEAADHSPAVWGKEQTEEKAVLCGACGKELTIREYVTSGSACPGCGAPFNPGCRGHYPLYFDLSGTKIE